MTVDLEQAVMDGERLKAFLADETVQAAFKRCEMRYQQGFLEAKTTDELRTVQVKMLVLRDLALELSSVVANGVHAKHAVEQQKIRAEQNRPRR